jgi:hypothetical protein
MKSFLLSLDSTTINTSDNIYISNHFFICLSFLANSNIYLCFFGDRNVQSSPLSIKDQEEKAKRCEFVHGLFLSTIPVDN